MARRRWKCFATYNSRGYQKKRSRSHRREFVRGGADPKITRYHVGDPSDRDWDLTVGLIGLQTARISHLALEAIRVGINRRLTKSLGRTGFHLHIRTHPHTTYREHAMMSFAGADRLSSGMRNSFGRPVGRCARVKAGKILFECSCDLKGLEAVKESVRVAADKICIRTQAVVLRAKTPELMAKAPIPAASKFAITSKY